jgi:glycosyltransferase involved in cell wall biosynthesis
VRTLIITPAFNECEHLPVTAAALLRQTRPPDCWVVVDDGSTDGTLALLHDLRARIPFLRIVATGDDRRERDGLADASVVRAFNRGLRAAGPGWDLIGKLDADIELPPDYLERLAERFAQAPDLGIAGGGYVEPLPHGGWHRMRIPEHNVPGALKLYRAECLERIGGLPEVLGWDTIDETYARMRGYATRSFPDLVARHHRRTGAVSGVVRGRARHGTCAWIAHYPAYFVALRSLKLAALHPRGLSGAAFLWGYLRAALTATPRVADDAFRRHMRRELRLRVTSSLLRGGTP